MPLDSQQKAAHAQRVKDALNVLPIEQPNERMSTLTDLQSILSDFYPVTRSDTTILVDLYFQPDLFGIKSDDIEESRLVARELIQGKINELLLSISHISLPREHFDTVEKELIEIQEQSKLRQQDEAAPKTPSDTEQNERDTASTDKDLSPVVGAPPPTPINLFVDDGKRAATMDGNRRKSEENAGMTTRLYTLLSLALNGAKSNPAFCLGVGLAVALANRRLLDIPPYWGFSLGFFAASISAGTSGTTSNQEFSPK